MFRKVTFFVVFSAVLFAEIPTITAPPAIFLEKYDEYKWQTRIGLDLMGYSSDHTDISAIGFGIDTQRRIDSNWFLGFGAKYIYAFGSDTTHYIYSKHIPLEATIGYRMVINQEFSFAPVVGAIYRYSSAEYDSKRYINDDYEIDTDAVGGKAGVVARWSMGSKVALEPYYTYTHENFSKEYKTQSRTVDENRAIHTYGADLLLKHFIFGLMFQNTKDESDLTMFRIILRF